MTADGGGLGSLQLRSIDVRSAPGIPHGYRLDAFSPGINIITGPNSSGKSTTSRLLRQLFWSRDTDADADYRVTFRYTGAEWAVRSGSPGGPHEGAGDAGFTGCGRLRFEAETRQVEGPAPLAQTTGRAAADTFFQGVGGRGRWRFGVRAGTSDCVGYGGR